jgi:hypothetical protein
MMNPTMSETHLLPKSKLFPKINLPSLQHQPEINNQIISSSSTSKISLSSHVYKSDSLFLTDAYASPSSKKIKTIHNKSKSITNNNNNNTHNKICKTIEASKSPKDKRRKLFEKLYGITPEFQNAYENAKKKKHLPLMSYQNSMLNVYGKKNVERERFIDLSTRLKQIRDNALMVKPLPPIDFKIIYEHSKNEMKSNEDMKLHKGRMKKKDRKMLKHLILEHEHKDAFELEMENMNRHKRTSTHHNNIDKSLYALPQPVIDILTKKLKLSSG